MKLKGGQINLQFISHKITEICSRSKSLKDGQCQRPWPEKIIWIFFPRLCQLQFIRYKISLSSFYVEMFKDSEASIPCWIMLRIKMYIVLQEIKAEWIWWLKSLQQILASWFTRQPENQNRSVHCLCNIYRMRLCK